MNVEQFANVASQKLYDLLAKEKPLFAIEKWGPAIAVPIGKAKKQWLVGGIVAE